MPINRLNKKYSLREYQSRLNKALDFINGNLDKKIKLEEIAAKACFSQFHFHRIFSYLVGETPVDFVNRLRLERAANLLLKNSSSSITEVSLLCGFSSSAVFSRSFKKHFGVSASVWKEQQEMFSKNSKTKSKKRKAEGSQHGYFDFAIKIKEGNEKMKVEIKNLPGYRLAYAANLEGYSQTKIEKAWQTLCQWATPRGLINESTVWIGISFDNPDITPAEKCRYYACINMPENVEPSGEIGKIILPAGKYAVLSFKGFADEIAHAYKYLYSSWLPVSGFQPADTPCFEIYYSTPDQNPEKKFIMDICLPVKPL